MSSVIILAWMKKYFSAIVSTLSAQECIDGVGQEVGV